MTSDWKPGQAATPDDKSSTVGDLSDPRGSLTPDTVLRPDAGPATYDREKYLEQVRADIEKAQELQAELTHCKSAVEVPQNLMPFLRTNKPAAVTQETTVSCILHIDDDLHTRLLVSQTLSSAGYTVISAESGFAGVDQFRRRPYDFSLVLTDLTMPLMDGEETFERLREIRSDIPVILVTGFIQDERLTRLRNVGLAGFLRKPIPPDEIVNTVRATLESVRYSGGNLSVGGAVAF